MLQNHCLSAYWFVSLRSRIAGWFRKDFQREPQSWSYLHSIWYCWGPYICSGPHHEPVWIGSQWQLRSWSRCQWKWRKLSWRFLLVRILRYQLLKYKIESLNINNFWKFRFFKNHNSHFFTIHIFSKFTSFFDEIFFHFLA